MYTPNYSLIREQSARSAPDPKYMQEVMKAKRQRVARHAAELKQIKGAIAGSGNELASKFSKSKIQKSGVGSRVNVRA